MDFITDWVYRAAPYPSATFFFKSQLGSAEFRQPVFNLQTPVSLGCGIKSTPRLPVHCSNQPGLSLHRLAPTSLKMQDGELQLMKM